MNYEHKRKSGTIKSKTKNIKLKYSRMLTCYSAIIYLLAAYSKEGTVRPEDVRRMVSVTPTQRLYEICLPTFWDTKDVPSSLEQTVKEALRLYSEFLELVHKDETVIATEFEERQREWRERSHQFGQKLAEILGILRDSSDAGAILYRMVLT